MDGTTPGGYPAPHGPYPRPAFDPAIATPGVRLGARVIDLAIMWFCLIVVIGTVGRAAEAVTSRDLASELGPASLVAVVLLYEWLPTAAWGGTPGKLLLRIRVVRLDRGPVGYPRAAGRALATWLFWFVPILGLLDKIWLLWDRPFTQCLHDKAASTVVVRRG